MTRPLSPRAWLSLGCAALLATDSPLPAQVAPASKDIRASAAPSPATTAAVSPDLVLLGALRSNPDTAPYRIGTSMRGGRVVLWGRVGTKYVHDVAVRIAIDLGYPFRDDLVIDTAEAHRVAAFAAVPAVPLVGPVGGMGPYGVYPPPLFGRLDDPFYGMEPPLISYPPWWRAVAGREPIDMTALANAGLLGDPEAGAGTVAGPDASVAVATDQALQKGTVEMTINPRGRATLRGAVPTLADRIAIGQKLAQTPGVSEVLNLLTVGGTDGSEPPPPPVPVPGRSGKPPAAPRSVPRDSSRPDMPAPAGVPIDPERPQDDLSDRLSRTFAERPALAGLPIKITARDGVVTLAGRLPTVYEAMLAFRAAQQTPGVLEVVDRLEFVVPDGEGKNPLLQKGRPEDVEPYLTAQIRRQVDDLAHVDGVRLRGDTLTIQGTLRRGDDQARLDAILNSMAVLRGFRLEPKFTTQ
ncbi:MAG: BON domain-containing protein [Singulisphaera sp.]